MRTIGDALAMFDDVGPPLTQTFELGLDAPPDATIALVGAAPGSTSQCNAERRGLRMAYTRVKWHRPAAP